MIKAFLFDFSRTLLFPKDKNYTGGLNSLHKGLSENANYRFLDNFELNKELMDYLFSIKEKMSIYMFTSETIQETPEIKSGVSKVFSRIFSAKEMGMDKKDPETYKFISNELKLELHVLMQELSKLASVTPKLAQEVQIAAFQAPVNPGIYHLVFFEKLNAL